MATSPAAQHSLLTTLSRGLQFLLLFEGERQEWTLSDAARAINCSPAMAFRVLRTLAHWGFVTRDPDTKAFRLGEKVRILGAKAGVHRGIADIARPVLESLMLATQETVILTTRDGIHSRIVATVEGSRWFRTAAREGALSPLYAGASNKPLLAFLPEPVRERYLRALELRPYTEKTPTSIDALRKDLDEIRVAGFAVSDGEVEPGIVAVGAPVFNAQGYPIAAISVSAPSERFDRAKINRAIQQVVAHTEELRACLGGGIPPESGVVEQASRERRSDR